MKANLTLKIKSGQVNGQGMNLCIRDQRHVLFEQQNIAPGEFALDLDVQFPAVLTFDISGRGANDTQINSKGDIVADKFLSLDWFELVGKRISTYQLNNRILSYQTNSKLDAIPAFYWNCNGQAVLTIQSDDPLVWLLQHSELW